MSTGEAAAATVRDRIRDDRPQPADDQLQSRIEDDRAEAGHHEVQGEAVLAADQQPGHDDRDDADELLPGAELGDRGKDLDDERMVGDRMIEADGDALVEGEHRPEMNP